MKKILKIVLALALILVVLVLAHPLWIGPVVRTAVGLLAPKYLGVAAKLDGFSLNAYTGHLALDGFVLDNPPGYREKFAKVGHLSFDVNPTTVLSDTIVVEGIALSDFYVSLLTDDRRVYNFETVSETCSNTEKRAATSERPSAPPAAEAKPAKEKKSEKKKIIVDLIEIKNVLVQWERVPLPLPSFRMTGLGRGSADGVELEVAWKEFERQFIGALGPLAAGLQPVLSGGQVQMDAGLKAAVDASKSVGDATKALEDATKAMKDGSPESLDAAAKSINSAAKSIEGSVKQFKALFRK